MWYDGVGSGSRSISPAILVQGCKLAPVIGQLSGEFKVLTGKLRSLIGHPDGPHL